MQNIIAITTTIIQGLSYIKLEISFTPSSLSYRNLNEYDNAVSDLKTYISKTGAHDGYVALADVYFKMVKNKEAYAIASQGIAKYGNSGILRVLANNILKNKID